MAPAAEAAARAGERAAQLAAFRKQVESCGEAAGAEAAYFGEELGRYWQQGGACPAEACCENFGGYWQQDAWCPLPYGAAGFKGAALEEVSSAASTTEGELDPEFIELPAPTRAAAAAEAEVAAAPRPGATAGARPRYVNSLRMSQLSWEDLSSGREWRTALRLCYLPRRLCEPGALEALLRAQGLAEHVARVRALPAKGSLGGAVIRAKSAASVPALARFFHGRVLGGATPIAVSFVETGSRKDPRSAHLGEPMRVRSGAQQEGPWQPVKGTDSKECSASTAPDSPRSSAASEAPSARGEERPARRPLPPGVLPPPGLEAFCR